MKELIPEQSLKIEPVDGVLEHDNDCAKPKVAGQQAAEPVMMLEDGTPVVGSPVLPEGVSPNGNQAISAPRRTG